MGKVKKKPLAKKKKIQMIATSPSYVQKEMIAKELSLLEDIASAMKQESLYKQAAAKVDAEGILIGDNDTAVITVDGSKVTLTKELYDTWKPVKNLTSEQIYGKVGKMDLNMDFIDDYKGSLLMNDVF